jgi:hypothetical protein
MIPNTVPTTIAHGGVMPSRWKEVDVDQFCNNALKFHKNGCTVKMLVDHYMGMCSDGHASAQPSKRAIEKRLDDMVDMDIVRKNGDTYIWWRYAK